MGYTQNRSGKIEMVAGLETGDLTVIEPALPISTKARVLKSKSDTHTHFSVELVKKYKPGLIHYN